MNKQEIALALRDLEPEEALSVVTGWMYEQDMPHTIWQDEDIDSILEEKDVPIEERAAIIEKVKDSGYWRGLSDAHDAHWELIRLAVEEVRS